MGCTLKLLYDYVQDLRLLIEKADELAKKSVLRDELSRFYAFQTVGFENLSINESELMISLSRILVNYGFTQTYESFENACLLLLADYDRTKDAVNTAIEKLRQSALHLYDGETEASFLWKAQEVSDPWEFLEEMLVGNNDEAIARRNHYLQRIAELANQKSLASVKSADGYGDIALNLSPLRLELDFVSNDGILPEILSLHAHQMDLR